MVKPVPLKLGNEMRSHLITHRLILSSQSAKISFFYDVFMKFKILKQLCSCDVTVWFKSGPTSFPARFPWLGKSPW